MSDDIVDRLRGFYSQGPFGKRDFSPYVPPICNEAADEITQLREQLAKALDVNEQLYQRLAKAIAMKSCDTCVRDVVKCHQKDWCINHNWQGWVIAPSLKKATETDN